MRPERLRIGLAFAFAFASLVALASCEKQDPLFCEMNATDPRCVAGDGGVDSADGFAAIGGTVTGRMGGGLILLDNGGDDKLITSDGQFQFATGVQIGTAYAVTVGSQPSNPSQDCVVANGSGTATTDVTDVAVTCSTSSYAVGGTVVGYTSGTLTLQDNGGDDLAITANGTFAFPTKLASGATFTVGIKTGSTGSCSVSGGFGTVGNSDVTTVVVNCTTDKFTIGGKVMGLDGTVKLQNGSDTISVSGDGNFAFPTLIASGLMYDVTVSQQPSYPPASQFCSVSSGSGTVAGNVEAVVVTCTTTKYTVGGSVTGLTTGTLVLRDNGGDDKTITANGSFTFATAVYSGLTYAVTVATNPTGLTCSVAQGSGTIANANVTNVAVTCVDPGIKCGGSYCTGSEKCCDPESSTSRCVTGNQMCSQLVMACDDAADCSSGVCCATLHNGAVVSVSCQSSCSGQDKAQLCALGTSECGASTCKGYGNLSDYYSCQ